MVANVHLAHGDALGRRMPRMRFATWLACALLPCAFASAVGAQGAASNASTAAVRATIVRIDGDDYVVDAGHGTVAPGDELQVYRSLEVRHPITRKTLRDRFTIATVRVEQVGATLSIARLVGTPRHAIATGDAAESPYAAPAGEIAGPAETAAGVATATPAASGVTAARNTSAAQASRAAPASRVASVAGDAENAALGRVWRATLEQAPAARAQLYSQHLRAFPRSPHRELLLREIAYLRDYAASLETLAKRAQSVERSLPPELARSVQLRVPDSAAPGKPLPLAASVQLQAPVRNLLLHVRPAGESGFRSLPMPLDENRHARTTVPAELVRAPGLELFVEAVGRDGNVVPAVGTVSEPRSVRVREPDPEKRDRDALPGSRVRFSSELASFDGTSGRDYYLVSEGDFLLRLRRGHLYGVRMGYGHYRGEGGTLKALDEDRLEPATAGFTYGFLESEIAVTDLVGLALRGTLGLGRPESVDEQQDAVTGGFQLRVRLGAPEGTRLVVAGELLPEIGQRAFLALYWDVIERLPMAAEVQVTDQPVNSDELGVRLIYELGWRITPQLVVALRPSYQLRTIKHAGPGIGLAAAFDW
jgi:hypothetical protein